MTAPIYNRKNELPADGWYQIEVTGTHPAGDGRRQVIDEKALSSIVNRFEEDAAKDDFSGLLVDADHLSHDPSKDTAALAWLKALEIRNGQLFGKLDLTDLGEAALAGKRYKFFSSEYSAEDLEFLADGNVRPLRLSGLAFTNRPNNRGGKPISNRDGSVPDGQSETNDKTTMKTIAVKLGLSAEATEADILDAISALLKQCEEMATKQAEAEADAVLNRLGSRIPEAVRPQWRKELIKNRSETEKLMEASFPKAAGEASSMRIFNRAEAIQPECNFTADDAELKAQKQNTAVTLIRNREKCSFETAWNMAKGERPDLF